MYSTTTLTTSSDRSDMVAKKNLLPYPSSLQPQSLSPPTHQDAHHGIDSTDLPPIPDHPPRDYVSPRFETADNPWTDVDSTEVPDSQRPNQDQQNNVRRSQIPDVLRPGKPAELTPTSSREHSPEREEKDWWDDDDDNNNNEDQHQQQQHIAGNGDFVATVKLKPVKRKPVPSNLPTKLEPDLPSNNPYRRSSGGHLSPRLDQNVWATSATDEHEENRYHPSPGQLPLNHKLSNEVEEKQVVDPIPSAPPPPPHAPPPIPDPQPPLLPDMTGLPLHPWSTEKPVLTVTSPIPFDSSQQHETIPTTALLDRGRNRTRAGSLSLSDELMDIPNAVPPTLPSISAGSPLRLPSNSPPHIEQPALRSSDNSPSLLEDEDDGPRPQLPARPSTRQDSRSVLPVPTSASPPPPPKPPRPAVVTTPADMARLAEQRGETYQVKHFNWFDHRSKKLRRSSMLTQNKNGPCPLLALVNAMILGATEEMQATLDDALRLREQITLGLIIETLMDELLDRSMLCDGSALPEIDQLNMFLMRLRTGMNANPRFVPAAEPDAEAPTQKTPKAGTFELTSDIKLYNSFGVRLLHGWLPMPSEEVFAAFSRSAPTYEDAQAIQFGEEELEYKLSQSESGLTDQEQKVWQDIMTIKQFFQAHPTQLTPYGLQSIQTALRPGEFAILFRNDHFSTIYKHPRDGDLYTLITDAGYAERDEIIWESLSDVSGARSEFFSGEFQSVSHASSAEPYHHPIPHSQTLAANPRSNVMSTYAEQQTLDGQGHGQSTQQAQSDADFAMALQLQEEEEQQMRRARAQSQAANTNPANGRSASYGAGLGVPSATRGRGQVTGRRTGSSGNSNNNNIPIPLRSNRTSTQEESRPTIPPRRQRDGVTRPSDVNDPDAPPAYEEATRTPVYAPPIGSPLHPHSSADLSARASTSTTTIHATGQSTGFPFSSSASASASASSPNLSSNFGNGPAGSLGVLATRARERQNRTSNMTSSFESIPRDSTPRNLEQSHSRNGSSSAYNESTSAWSRTPHDLSSHASFGPGYGYMNSDMASEHDTPHGRTKPSRRGEDRDCSVM